MNVLVLAGGISNEHDVSLRSGAAVAAAIEDLGHGCKIADPASGDFNLTELTKDVDVVFIALHGEGGEDGAIQAQLEELGIPYTGCDSTSSALCFDKIAYKQLLVDNNLPASAGRTVLLADIASDLFTQPYVLKPITGGSSLDTQIVRSPDEASKHATRKLLEKYDSMLLEPLVSGTEITVGIFKDTALPVIEIIPPEGDEFDYENKYNGKTQELCPPVNVSEEIQVRARELALKIHKLCGCRDMSRTDMIIDSRGALHVLETNTIPGLTEQSLLPKMIRTSGRTFTQFVDELLQAALSRQP